MALNTPRIPFYLSTASPNPPGAYPGEIVRTCVINFTGSTFVYTASGMTGVRGIHGTSIGSNNAYLTINQTVGSDGVIGFGASGTNNAYTLVQSSTNAVDMAIASISDT